MTQIQVFSEDLSPERLELHMQACLNHGNNLAVDCEMMGLKPVRDRLCLIQICDPLKNVSLIQVSDNQKAIPLLQQLLLADSITKIFHFARADLAAISEAFGFIVYPIFCTKAASKIARTYTEKHSLRELAREFLGIDLNKNQQSSDWGRKKLSSEQIDYAAGDVLYLIELKNILHDMLMRENRLQFFEHSGTIISTLAEMDRCGYEYVFEHNNPGRK